MTYWISIWLLLAAFLWVLLRRWADENRWARYRHGAKVKRKLGPRSWSLAWVAIHAGPFIPALFGILTVAAAAAYASVFLILPLPAAVKVVVATLFTAIAAAMAYVIVQRTRELKEEDKDDIGKY